MVGAIGMLLAIAATLLSGQLDWTYIVLGIGIGSVVGAIAALRVKMTTMPDMDMLKMARTEAEHGLHSCHHQAWRA